MKEEIQEKYERAAVNAQSSSSAKLYWLGRAQALAEALYFITKEKEWERRAARWHLEVHKLLPAKEVKDGKKDKEL